MTFIAAAVIVMVLLFALLLVFQRRFIYFPDPYTPALSGEQVSFVSDDGPRLSGTFVPASGTPTGVTVLVLNGNAGHRGYRAPLASALSRAGFAVLLFDYRGYGGSEGSASEVGLLRDAHAAAAYLATRSDVEGRRIAYFGESLGAAVAVALALERPPLALVLRSPFTSLADMAALHYPFLPLRPFLVDRYPALDQIGRVAAPVLVMAGAADRIVPPENSRRLFAAAREPKRFVLVAGADHNDPELLAGRELVEEFSRFIAAASR